MLIPYAYLKGFSGLRNLVFKTNTLINLAIWIPFGMLILFIMALWDFFVAFKIMISSVIYTNWDKYDADEKLLVEERKVYHQFIKVIHQMQSDFEIVNKVKEF